MKLVATVLLSLILAQPADACCGALGWRLRARRPAVCGMSHRPVQRVLGRIALPGQPVRRAARAAAQTVRVVSPPYGIVFGRRGCQHGVCAIR